MKKEDSLPKKGDKFEMKKMIIAIVCAVVILIAGIFGAKALLFPGDKNPETDLDTPIVPITDAQNPNGQEANPDAPAVNIPAVTPVAPTGSDDPLKIYDNGAATFSYDSTKLIFDEIPPSEENGIPMVSFMPVDAEDVLPRVDAMPLTVSASDLTTSEVDSATAILEREDRKEIIARVLKKLPADESLVLNLFYLEECSIADIGQITDLTPSNIKVKLFRGRKHFYETLQLMMKNETANVL